MSGARAISPSTGRTLPDRYIEGTCPICGYGEARGDQCDNCGNQLDPTDLINPRSRINGETPQFVETQHFLLDLPALADALRAWLERDLKARGLAAPVTETHPHLFSPAPVFVAREQVTRIGEPEDIAGLVAFVVGPEGRFLQGALIDMDGGATRTI